jgi:two-component system, sensor histidine kinase and response regulator
LPEPRFPGKRAVKWYNGNRLGGRKMAGEHVMVVDDNDVNCMVAESMLKLLGYTVSVAKSGKQAIQIANETKFDLILMDWQMPELNGFDTATAIWNESKFNQKTKMIAVTANAFADDRNACINHGFSSVLTKPYDVDQLSDMITEYLKSA